MVPSMKRLLAAKLVSVASAVLLVLGASSVVTAACNPSLESCSSSFGVGETHFGSGGQLCSPGDANSPHSSSYCASTSAGDLGVGNAGTGTTSSDHQVQAGSGLTTSRAPSLEFSVTAGTTDLGYLSSASAKMTTGTFKVKTYLSDGYIIQTQSNPPTDNAPGHHQLNALSTPTASSPGTEQFGINLVQNSTIGANPQQIPDSTFGFGTVASGYNQANKFKYVKGDTIAQSTRSSGETDYTITYLFNISSSTPDGTYTLNHVLVATSTF